MLAAFAGIYSFEGTPSGDTVKSMLGYMSLPSHLDIVINVQGNVAIGRALPVAEIVSLEYESDTLFAASGTVCNKHDVMLRAEVENNGTESEFMKNAWLTLGDSAPEMMDGDWMFAGYHPSCRELFLARAWGCSSLYIYEGNGMIAFATHPMAFKAVDPQLKPDVDELFKGLCSKATRPNSTGVMGVRQLPLASWLKVSDGKIQQHTWWYPPQKRKRQKVDEPQVIKSFFDCFQKAVHQRVQPFRVASTLSAGLDSSSVCAITAELLKKQGGALTAYTSVPYYTDETCGYTNRLMDEGDLAKLAADYMGNVIHEPVDAADVNIIEAIKAQVRRTGKPLYAPANLYWVDEILRKSAEAGYNGLTIGQCGNFTVSWTPDWVPLFQKRRFFPNTSWKSYMRLTARRIHNLLQQKLKVKEHRLEKEYWLRPLAVNPEYDFSKVDKREFHYKNPMEGHMSVLDIWYHNGLHYGVEVLDPTMDRHLIELLYQIPEEVFFRDGTTRRLIRLAMKELLPNEICFNKRRGQQASDLVARVRHFGEDAEKAIEEIEESSLAQELLNIQGMREVLKRIRDGETGKSIFRDCNVILLRGIALGFFLVILDEK